MSKYSAEIKISACKEYLTRTISHEDICKKYGIPLYRRKNDSMIKEWLPYYLEYGEGAFAKNKGNNSYSSEIKKQAVEDYIYGNGSIRDIYIKYQIPSTKTLRQWIQVYNANRELKGYDPKREVYMAEAKRKTTLEERKEIVAYCLEHNRDYKNTAGIFDVSYSQVYSWVRKYNASGEDGLTDKRGHHKTDEEVDELERLRRENKRLKRQLEENDMVVQLLKKVKEFEGM